MGDNEQAAAGEVAAKQAVQGLAYVCTHLDEIRAVFAEGTTPDEVEKALTTASQLLRR